tara:strand:- start:768 stop:1007 length:240 start_codon:yes stop_codon:yes gene_type:complete
MSSFNQNLNSEESFADKEEKEFKTVPQNESATTKDIPDFGWSAYAERINGRFAMIGFSAVLLIELLSKKTFLSWANLIQ